MEDEKDRITYLKQILKRFKNNFDKDKKMPIEIFPKVSNQNYNREIKELFKKDKLKQHPSNQT